MSSIIETIYQGNYTCTTKSPLNEEPIVAKSRDFSPMDLLASAYGSCLLATIDYEARKQKFQTPDLRSEISYHMSEDRTRLGALFIRIIVDGDFSQEQKQVIEFSAKNKCHVGQSIDKDVKKEFEFIYS